ncbi:tripartite tricarboxylate transporter substrate binding protein [Variovorax ureilyticus]|uniref:Tripartite tricarboxylate transporter substrate binding protein n=1 Tax=Variovorax ureilyticus TaxID=1836198 RepID=A0ABU8VRA0_9BURK
MNFATKILCAALALAGASMGAHAQGYPSQPIKIVVGYQAGGPTDLTARLIADKMTRSMGQPIIVENKVGAGSNIASEFVAAAKPDGYTLLLAAAPISWNPMLYKNVKYDVLRSFEPIANVMTAPQILAVSTKLPVKDLKDLVALAKRQPGKLTYGSSGAGGSPHLAGELLKQRAGIDIVHVPYKGASGALNDLVAGHVDMSFMTSMSAIPHLASGNPKALAVASEKRLPQLPNVPTVAEMGYPGFEAESWNGLFAPAKTPPEIVSRLNAEVNKALQDPEVREKLTSQGAVVVGGTAQSFRSYLVKEVERWGGLMKTNKVTLD